MTGTRETIGTTPTATASARAIVGPIRAAATEKVASMIDGPDVSARALIRCAEGLESASPGLATRAIDLVAFVRTLANTPATAPYLSHPFRVARYLLESASFAPHLTRSTLLGVGILHNAFEVFDLDERALESRAGFSEREAKFVRLLTIDRAKERDLPYLTAFHGAIEEAGIALVRCMDKLDNLLGLELLAHGDVRDSYVDLADRFVRPLAERVDPGLGEVFAETVRFCLETPCDPVMLAEYERATGKP
ncbi:MAG: hypothetical protein U0169_16290 [Polyangiaceae bacterium]